MIDLFKPNTYTTLINGEQENEYINRLTVFFNDGDARIEEIHQSVKDNISTLEFDGNAFSVTLPSVLFDVDIESIYTVLAEPIKSKDWQQVKKIMTDLEQYVDFYDDYIDGAYEDCETDEEMQSHIKKHGRDVKKIADEIRLGGGTYVRLNDWIENYLERNKNS